MQDSFSQDLFRNLPAEVQLLILKFIGPCWYLIVPGETRRLIDMIRSSRTPQADQLSLSQDVFVSTMRYQGSSYICGISNTAPGLPCDGLQVQRLNMPSNVKRLALSIDHVGIRNVQFMSSTSDVSRDRSPWYKVIDVTDDEQRSSLYFNVKCLPLGLLHILTVNTQGLFLKDVELQSGSYPITPRVWNIPYPPTIQPWNIYNSKRRSKRRLHYLEFGPDFQGILTCCSSFGRNVGIFPFAGKSKGFQEFVSQIKYRRREGEQIYWIYFPIAKGEAIQTAWFRKFDGIEGEACSPILVVCYGSLS